MSSDGTEAASRVTADPPDNRLVRPRTPALAYAALACGVAGLGCSAIFVKWANAPGAISGAYRVGIAALALAVPFGLQARRGGPLPARQVCLAVLAGLFFAGDLASWNTAVLITSAANSTLLANTSPLWVGLGALVLFNQRLRPRFWGGLVVAMAGSALVYGADVAAQPDLGLGDLLSLLAGVFYAGFFLATERARRGLTSLAAWWLSTATSGVALLGFALVLGQPWTGYPAATYWNLLAVALVTQVGAYLAINYALGHLPATIVSPTLLGQPVLTAVLAVPLLGQGLTVAQVAGGAVVLTGIRMVHRSGASEPLPATGARQTSHTERVLVRRGGPAAE